MSTRYAVILLFVFCSLADDVGTPLSQADPTDRGAFEEAAKVRFTQWMGWPLAMYTARGEMDRYQNIEGLFALSSEGGTHRFTSSALSFAPQPVGEIPTAVVGLHAEGLPIPPLSSWNFERIAWNIFASALLVSLLGAACETLLVRRGDRATRAASASDANAPS